MDEFGEFGFWLGIALVVVAYIWAEVREKQMKHELTLKLLDQGQGVDQELLSKLLAVQKQTAPAAPKPLAEQRRAEGGLMGFIFLVAGLIFTFVGIRGSLQYTMLEIAPGTLTRVPDGTSPSWLLIGLGAFTFAFGYLCWHNTMKEYAQLKAEEKQSKD